MLGLKKKTKPKLDHQNNLPPETCIYAIGDIHGRADLLKELHLYIAKDLEQNRKKNTLIVYLGDYVDRGPNSRAVIEQLITHKFDDVKHVYLMGNHEYALLNFLASPALSDAWLAWGGDATLKSYGVHIYEKNGGRMPLPEIGTSFAEAMPDSHLAFLQNLTLYHQEGNYLFVHAGIRPGLPLNHQSPYDMMMIREEFIFAKKPLNQIVVFGHTIFDEPYIDATRIGIDTGAYYTDKLTCAVISNEKLRFITT